MLSTRSDPQQTVTTAWTLASGILSDFVAYQRDAWERSVLFLDALRQRADNMLAHERAGKPPLLDFDYEIVVDARGFDRPPLPVQSGGQDPGRAGDGGG